MRARRRKPSGLSLLRLCYDVHMHKNQSRGGDEQVLEFRHAVVRLAQLEAEVAAQRALVDELQGRLASTRPTPRTAPPAAKPASRKPARTLSKTRPSLVAVRDVIANKGGSGRIEDVIADLGIKHGAAAVRLQRACEAGLIHRTAHGVYEVVPGN